MALGHNSKPVHRAYAKKAQVKPLRLEEYKQKIVRFNPHKTAAAQVEPEQTAQAISV
jgi:hypothetical protein